MQSQRSAASRFGTGQGRWWPYKTKSDEGGVSGPPGTGTTSSGYTTTDFGQWDIALASYPDSVSPWGLLDTSGGTGEWTEFVLYYPDPAERALYGSWAGDGGFPVSDHVT